MDDQVIKHLEFIQNILRRMSQNSFLLKAWCVSLITILFFLLAKDFNVGYSFLFIIVVLSFWHLDAFYLRQERLFRKLYDGVRKGKKDYNFDMSTEEFKVSFIGAFFSRTISGFYITLLLALTLLIISKSCA